VRLSMSPVAENRRDSLKIEGRTKSPTTWCEPPELPPGDRRCRAGRTFNTAHCAHWKPLANRATPMASTSATHVNTRIPHRPIRSRRQTYVATSSPMTRPENGEVVVKNRFAVGDRLESSTLPATANVLEQIFNQKGAAITEAPVRLGGYIPFSNNVDGAMLARFL